MGALEHRSKKRRLNPLPAPRRLAPIEQLPQEILEQVYIASRNVRLLYASTTLRDRLSSGYARKGILRSAFLTDDLATEDEQFHELRPVSESKKKGPGSLGFVACGFCPVGVDLKLDRAEACPKAMLDLFAVLREEWVTMPLVKSVVLDWLWETATSELKRFLRQNKFPESDYEPACVRLRHSLDKSTSNMTVKEIQSFVSCGGPNTNCSYSQWHRTTASCAFDFLWPPTGACPSLRIGFFENAYDAKTPLGYMQATVTNRTADGDRYPIRNIEKRFVNWRSDLRLIPPRLLRGPWTQDRGDLLKFLMDQCDDTYLERGLTATQLAAAHEGVQAALREGCSLALETLLGKWDSGIRDFCQPSLYHSFFAADRETPPADFASPLGDRLWKRFSWSRDAMPVIGIPHSTEQLAYSIDHWEEHPRLSAQYVASLLPRPTSSMPPLPPGFVRKLNAQAERADLPAGKPDFVIARKLAATVCRALRERGITDESEPRVLADNWKTSWRLGTAVDMPTDIRPACPPAMRSSTRSPRPAATTQDRVGTVGWTGIADARTLGAEARGLAAVVNEFWNGPPSFDVDYTGAYPVL